MKLALPSRAGDIQASFDAGDLALPLFLEGFLLFPVDTLDRVFVSTVSIGGAVEERIELKVLFVSERVVFVRMALSATSGGPHPYRHGCIDSVYDRGRAELLIDSSAFAIGHGVAMKSGRNQLRYTGVWKQVTSELLDGELVEGHVRIDRPDYPVTPSPNGSWGVVCIACRVCVTSQVEPWRGPAFTKTL